MRSPVRLVSSIGDRSVVRPLAQRVRRECRQQSLVMACGRLGADAGAGALPDLAREARTLAALEAQKAPAKAAVRGNVAQRLTRGAARAERTVKIVHSADGSIDSARTYSGADGSAATRSAIRSVRRRKPPVVGGEQLLDELRLAQQGAKLAGGFLDFDANDSRRTAAGRWRCDSRTKNAMLCVRAD